jgi:nucleotide sugar dehydrogenase
MKIAVIGAGKMGLPLACQFAHMGGEVISCDVNPMVVQAINACQCPFEEPGLAELLHEVASARRLSATTDIPRAVSESDLAVVIVPALLTPERDIDATAIRAVCRDIAKALRVGMLICIETTLAVGGTRRFVLPVLEETGFKAGIDFDLAYSPERVKSQSVLRNLTANPKIVGGITQAAAARATDFYRSYLGAQVINVGSLEAAEMVKLAGMVYRDVNIALANELARYAEVVGLDLVELVEAVNSDGEAGLLHPGIGVGGHCTPVYPYFLIRDAERVASPLTLAEQARRINDSQVRYVLDRLERTWGSVQGLRVLILGLSFRPRVKEHTFSTAFLLRRELEERKAKVFLYDPLYSKSEIRAHGFVPADLQDGFTPEVLILNTAHDAYRHLEFDTLNHRGLQVVVDGRRFWDPGVIIDAGLDYIGIGRPSHHSGAAAS